MKTVLYNHKDWTVGLDDAGTPVAFGPGGVSVSMQNGYMHLGHDAASYEFAGCLVSEVVSLPIPFLVEAMRAHGFAVDPPKDAA